METIQIAGAQDAPEAAPCNGIQGLRHWRNDLVAGLVVSLISLPLSLGIAVASGAPPICGIISAIIAGLVFPFIGGAFVTISGPAAGLAPVILGSILVLGRGQAEKGYELCLVAIFLAGCLQLILSRTHAAKLGTKLPTAAVEGMLAAIGILLITKQFPKLIAHPVGVVCLAILIGMAAWKKNPLRAVPGPLLIVIIGTIIAAVVGIDKSLLIKIPENILNGITMPDFAGVISDKTLWWSMVSCVLTLTFVDAFESLATIAAIDRMDPFHRKSDPDRTLLCMGTSNILSSMAGGLTIIPGGIKSTTNILSGGKTLWANFFNALFLIAYVVLFRDFINMIPLCVLAAVLVHIGYGLCSISKVKHVAKQGVEELLVFLSTIIGTLCTDLLVGLLIGSSVKGTCGIFHAWQRRRDAGHLQAH